MALRKMYAFIRETIPLSGLPNAKGTVIFVANANAAKSLCQAVDINDVIVYLEPLYFPGLANLPPSYVAHFRACGLGKHTPWESAKPADDNF